MNVIILLGQRVRSGTNFAGSTLSMHPDIVCIPPMHSFGELNLFRSDLIKTHIFDRMVGRNFGTGLKSTDFPLFMKEYGKFWVNFFIEKYGLPKDQTIFIKSPFVSEIDLWKMAFPDSQIAILCRDGRDNVISSIKASNDRRNWHTFLDRNKKQFNYITGRYFLNHTVDWKKTSQIILNTEEGPQLKLFRYEDLNDSEEGLTELLNFYKLHVDVLTIKKCLNAPVVGSSFGIDKQGVSKPNWKPNKNKHTFKFTGKWDDWNRLKKAVFKKIAGRELIRLGYEKNNKW